MKSFLNFIKTNRGQDITARVVVLSAIYVFWGMIGYASGGIIPCLKAIGVVSLILLFCIVLFGGMIEE